MIVHPKQTLHAIVDRLSDEEVQAVAEMIGSWRAASPSKERQTRPLTRADIVLAEPIMPDDETADEMIATVRRWRREGGYA